MKHIKLFHQLNEEKEYNYQNFLEEFVEKLPGVNDVMGTMNFNSASPTVIFKVWNGAKNTWIGISELVNDKDEVIKWAQKNLDELIFGETPEDVEKTKKETDIREIDFNKDERFIKDAIKFANTYGLVINRGILLVRDKSTFPPEAWINFIDNDEMKNIYKGRIGKRKFGFK